MKPSDLAPERWRRIDAVFEAALETPPPDRAAFLAESCGDDDDLRSEVEALLEAHARAEAHFESPVSPIGAALLASSEALPEDRRVGPFRLLREIGRGGMGVVYLAEDTRLGRRVALKALPPYVGVGREAKRRFISEARAVSGLDHPNIATLYEIDETEQGQLYMAFAYYEGETLADRIARGPLPVAEVIEIAAQIARGLEAAHERGVVHRDVKPSNVLLTEAGEVKLLDFGVAKVTGEDVTREGVRLGTVAYMSPEQAGGDEIDGRSDLWSLGVVLHEMLTGERPFQGTDHVSLLQSILHDDPEPVGPRENEIPDALERIVEKLLFKEAEGRYQDAEELLVDLDSAAAGQSPPVATRAPPAARGRGPLALPGAAASLGRWWSTILAGLILLAGGAWLASRVSSGGAGGGIERVAVLPLTDRTGDAKQEHIVAGVHDALIAELGKIGSLGVISRTSVVRYRDTQMPIPEIARELQVDALVEGSVSLDGDSLAVTTTLVRAFPERQLWTDSYRRGLGDVFEVSAEVARSIATELGVGLSPAEDARLAPGRSVNPEAYDVYALGSFHLEQRSREGFDQARRYFLEAIEIDSTFAPAYAGLAEVYGSGAFFGLGRPSRIMPRVKTLAETALRHDSTLAYAHSMRAAVALYWEWDWETAERHTRRALEINPSDAKSHRRLSEILSVQGRYDEALALVERASELDRMIPFSAFRPVVVLNYMRDFDRAIERAEEGIRFFPNIWQGHWLLCEALAGAGLYDRAITACEEATRLSDRLARPLATLGYVYARVARRADASRIASELEDRAEAAYVGGSDVAVVHGALGDLDRAFAWLDRAYEERDVSLVHLNDHAWFDPLRSDPRFDILLERIGLARPT